MVPGTGAARGRMVTFNPIGVTVVPEEEFGHQVSEDLANVHFPLYL